MERPYASGSFGEVFIGTLNGKDQVILKRARQSAKAQQLLRIERKINERLDERNTSNPAHWPKYLGTHDVKSRTYLVWRRIRNGITLDEYLFRKPLTSLCARLCVLSPPTGLRHALFRAVTKEVLQALDAIHERGVVHRDVKPENIVLGSSQGMRLIDFGSAANTRAIFWRRGPHTQDPLFAAPEQRADARMPDRFDVFSVAVIGVAALVPGFESESRLREFRQRLQMASFDLYAWRARADSGEMEGLFGEDEQTKLCFDVLAAMFRKEPKDRISVQAALALLGTSGLP